jgi:hypothetical protein
LVRSETPTIGREKVGVTVFWGGVLVADRVAEAWGIGELRGMGVGVPVSRVSAVDVAAWPLVLGGDAGLTGKLQADKTKAMRASNAKDFRYLIESPRAFSEFGNLS